MSHEDTRDGDLRPENESPEPPSGEEEEEQSHSSTNFIILNEDQLNIRGTPRRLKSIHPWTRPLTIRDLESCVALENAAFEEHERCSREKFMYRLTKCGELSFGIFCTAALDSEMAAETLKTGRVVETGRKDGEVGVLLGHIVSTMSSDNVVTDQAMDYPHDWRTRHSSVPSTTGHQDKGRTICLHSLGVVPKYQGRGFGRIILTAYLQQMATAGIADRVAIIAHDHLVPYYERFGFAKIGPSEAQFGGGGWIDMAFDLNSAEKLMHL